MRAILAVPPAAGTAEFTMLTNQSGILTITGLSFRDAVASTPQAAGAIENDGTLTITDSSFTGNVTAGFGGAIDNSGTLTVVGTSFDGNQAADGGAIENLAVAVISSSTFAIYADWMLSAAGSQITGNTASGSGGIYDGSALGPTGTVALAGSTVSGNHPDNCERIGKVIRCAGPAWTAKRPAAGSAGVGALSRADRARLLAADFYPAVACG